jgi:DNA invertase Pin-like site-specific DNA recombinase
MTGKDVGYIRVSSKDQNTVRQLEGVKLDKVFTDTMTGSLKERPQLDACLSYLRDGDVLHVHCIDRLARNLRDLQELVDGLVIKGITVIFEHERLVFSGDDTPIQKMTLQIMGVFAEFERSMIKSRQREGIDAAKAKGIPLGRRPKLNNHKLIASAKQLRAQGMKKVDIAKELCLSRPSINKLLVAG